MTLKQLQVREATGSVAPVDSLAAGEHRFRIRIIEGDVQGSSGYYPGSVVERDGPTAFPRGTHMHLDHMTFWEMMEGSPGSLRTMVGIIDSTPVYETVGGIPGLYADARVFTKEGEFLKQAAPYIGVSILAAATSEPGVIDGVETEVITSIVASLSVDFVTHPGANGRITQILEGAPALWPEAHPKGVTVLDAVPASGQRRNVIEKDRSTTRATGTKPKERKPMAELSDETAKGLQTSIEALVASFQAQETARADAEKARVAAEAATTKPDPAEVIKEITKALLEAKLPGVTVDRVMDAVTRGATVTDAIKAEKDYLELATKGTGTGTPSGGTALYVVGTGTDGPGGVLSGDAYKSEAASTTGGGAADWMNTYSGAPARKAK